MYVMGEKFILIYFNYFMWRKGQSNYDRYMKRGNIV